MTTQLHICLVGPLPMPAGGMANQTAQLRALLEAEGHVVDMVRTNAPCRPGWLARLPYGRAVARLLPFACRVWCAAGRAQLMHVMANSGWSWHLLAAPAIWIGHLRRCPVLVNYRGGEAEDFMRRAHTRVAPTLRRARVLMVPSRFLATVFGRHGYACVIVPNALDLGRFAAAAPRTRLYEEQEQEQERGPVVLVARHLQPLYDIGTALRAFALLRASHPHARLVVAGDGPERGRLQDLARQLEVADAVQFCGLLDHAAMAGCYRTADIVLNPSLADNAPNSVLEALASGVPVVSTCVGGVPYLVRDGREALLVPPCQPQAMAQAMQRVVDDGTLAARLRAGGLLLARRHAWSNVYPRLLGAYNAAMSGNAASMSRGRT